MKKISLAVFFLLIFSLQSFAQQQGHIMNEMELEQAYEKAISNPDVISYSRFLESQGYTHIREGSVGIVRDSDGAFFINLAFNKGNDKLTSHIIYRKWSDGSEKVSFWEAEINEDGTISTISEFLIQNGQRSIDLNEMSNVVACYVSWCGGSLVGCAFANCLYLKCVLVGCTTALVGCVLQWFLGG